MKLTPSQRAALEILVERDGRPTMASTSNGRGCIASGSASKLVALGLAEETESRHYSWTYTPTDEGRALVRSWQREEISS